MKHLALCVALLPATVSAGTDAYFGVEATFRPPLKAKRPGAIEVQFTAKDPAIRINEDPAPRIKLEPGQTALIYKEPAPSSAVPTFTPELATYLDLTRPVSFPVFLGPSAANGTQSVKGIVTFFYCSKKEGWCKKGSSDFEVAVKGK